MKLIIIRGIPGSGKSTKAKTYGCAHYEADQYFLKNGKYVFNIRDLSKAHEWCRMMVETTLQTGKDVVVSNTFTTNKEMKQYIELAEKYNADVEIITMLTNYGSIHNVPAQTIVAMKNRFEKFNIQTHLTIKESVVQ